MQTSQMGLVRSQEARPLQRACLPGKEAAVCTFAESPAWDQWHGSSVSDIQAPEL